MSHIAQWDECLAVMYQPTLKEKKWNLNQFYVVSVEHFCLGLQINVEEENLGKEERLVCVEVQTESSSVAAVCGLHHAVLRRIQVQTSPCCHINLFRQMLYSWNAAAFSAACTKRIFWNLVGCWSMSAEQSFQFCCIFWWLSFKLRAFWLC